MFGSFVVDLASRVPHLPVRGETVRANSFKMGPGGKGSNQAVAAKRAGADVSMVAKVGTDELAKFALESFEREGIDTATIYQDPDYPTASALIMVDEETGENEIAVYLGANESWTPADISRARPVLESADILVLQLEVNLEANLWVVDLVKDSPNVQLILNPAPARELPPDLLRRVDILTPNETEAQILTGIEVVTPTDAERAAQVLLDQGVGAVIVTLGEKGSVVVTENSTITIPVVPVEVIDTTGAGDAYNGGLAAGLARGLKLEEGARYASVVGALSVTKVGTAPAMPYKAEIEDFIEKRKST